MTLLTLIPALLNNGIPQIQNIIGQLPNHPSKVYAKRDLSEVKTLVVHHMASEAPLINQAKYHVNGRNWPRIGYHFVITNGMIYQTNYLDTESYHTKGNNRTGVGVAILGDLTKRIITPRESDLLTAVLASLKAVFPDAEIKGHNECGVKTSCPATNMNTIRNEVATLELKIEASQKPDEQVVKAFAVKTRLDAIYNIATSAGKHQPEGLRKMGLMHDWMEKEGLL